ncbi:MAG: hypothetical protein V5783_01675 [Pontiella sp.]
MNNNEKLIVGAVATVVGFSMVGNCSKARARQDVGSWENSHGTQGFINLNDVREAFRSNESMQTFENRVNEIFEGDNLIVFEAKELGNGFELKGYEDLDASKSKTSKDDLLFTLSVKGRTAELKGAGVNSYYKDTWIYEPPPGSEERVRDVQHRSSFASSPFFWWWVLSPGWGGYYTPMGRYNSMYSHRTTYRNSGSYGSQVGRNAGFEGQMGTKYGSNFRNSMGSSSAQRKSYIRTAPKSPGFKEKVAASKGKTGAAKKSQFRSSSRKSGSFHGTSSSRSSSSRGYGGFRGSSGF